MILLLLVFFCCCLFAFVVICFVGFLFCFYVGDGGWSKTSCLCSKHFIAWATAPAHYCWSASGIHLLNLRFFSFFLLVSLNDCSHLTPRGMLILILLSVMFAQKPQVRSWSCLILMSGLSEEHLKAPLCPKLTHNLFPVLSFCYLAVFSLDIHVSPWLFILIPGTYLNVCGLSWKAPDCGWNMPLLLSSPKSLTPEFRS